MYSSEEIPFYRQTRYTNLIKKELDEFIATKNTVYKFIGDNISCAQLEEEVKQFAIKHGIKKDDITLQAKDHPRFFLDAGPGIQLSAEVFPTTQQIDEHAKKLLLQLREKIAQLIEQQEQLDQIPIRVRNLLLNISYIES